MFPVSKISGKEGVRILKSLSHFDSFKPYNQVFFFDGVEVVTGRNKSYLITVSINSVVEKVARASIRRENMTELEFAGLTNMRQDYGRVWIRPETFADKVNELVNPVEVDFTEDPEFSSKYYVLTTDVQKFKSAVSPDFLSTIKKHEGMEIEINGRSLMVRLSKRTSVETALMIANFLNEISSGKIPF